MFRITHWLIKRFALSPHLGDIRKVATFVVIAREDRNTRDMQVTGGEVGEDSQSLARRTDYIICRIQGKMKTQSSLFNN